MMNRTKIEWTDYTWNPVTGCWGPGGTAEKPNRCSYCYAWKINARFAGGRILSGNMAGHEHLDPFAPRFHPDRLSQPAKVKKPSKIFVCSMSDLFGDWVPEEWIEAVLNRTQRADYSHHTYQFLTKNPKRLKDFNPWPSNCWVGTTVTRQKEDWNLVELIAADAKVRFVSHEPLLEDLDLCIRDAVKPIHWAIVGAMTGPGALRPKTGWVQGLVDQYRTAKVPLFLKDNLKRLEKIQEWPA